MPTAAHHRARVVATVGAGAAHAALSFLGAVDLLNYTVPTRYELIDQVAAQPLWTWIHAIIAILLWLTLFRPYARWRGDGTRVMSIACSVAFAAMSTWAFFNLMWGLSTVRPVSLAGPVMAFVVAAGEYLLANAWTRGTHDKGR